MGWLIVIIGHRSSNSANNLIYHYVRSSCTCSLLCWLSFGAALDFFGVSFITISDDCSVIEEKCQTFLIFSSNTKSIS